MNPGPAGAVQLQQIFTRLIGISVTLAFIALTIVLFYAGVRYLTSGGDAKSLGAAHQAMTWAILGILFLVLAWLILRLIEAFTGVPVSIFCIGFPTGASPVVGLNDCK